MGCNHQRSHHGHRPPFRGRLHRLSVLRLELPLLRTSIQPGARRRRQV
jgi:hypothetical protein